MKTIDADTAKLAGLQIDMLQKLRLGHMTLDHIDWFNGLSRDTRDALMVGEKSATSAEPTAKFTLLVDLGVITIPKDPRLDSFLAMNRKKFYDVNKYITDANFPNPSRILKPGDKIGVRVYKQVVEGTTTSDERMKFLRQQPGNIFVGAQGIPPVWEQVRDKLPENFWYASFDEEDLLPFLGDYHRVPRLLASSGGDWYWSLGSFGEVWYDHHAFFGFRDLSQTLDT